MIATPERSGRREEENMRKNPVVLVMVAGMVLLAGVLLGATGERGPLRVGVVNFPLDAEGNLKVKEQAGAFRFVGVTTAKLDGAAGWATMTRQCFAEYSGARMAFSDEYPPTINPPDVPEDAWIQPRPKIAIGDGAFLDDAGVPYGIGENCGFWESNFPLDRGVVVTPSGRVKVIVGCEVLRPIACAAEQSESSSR